MNRPVELRLSGSGGQGLQFSARVLAEALLHEGRTVAQSQSYEPTSRGGVSRSDLVVSDGGIDYPLVTRLDYLVILDEVAAQFPPALLKPTATILVDESRLQTSVAGPWTIRRSRFCEIARSLGNERAGNIVALGALTALASLCSYASMTAALTAETPPKFLALNREALDAGWRLVQPTLAAEAANAGR
ncbi:MAG: 2-oxoacid:acceptor oxidoreductase family protein [Defluviicoccus sp.]